MKEALDHPGLSLVRDTQDELGVCLVEKKIEGKISWESIISQAAYFFAFNCRHRAGAESS